MREPSFLHHLEALVGTLTAPSSYSTSLASATFTASGIGLAASSTYGIVLSAPTGTFDWSWTSTDAGSGARPQDIWARSTDSGTSWFAFNSSPTQFRVDATVTG
jgi:hypothetical protein